MKFLRNDGGDDHLFDPYEGHHLHNTDVGPIFELNELCVSERVEAASGGPLTESAPLHYLCQSDMDGLTTPEARQMEKVDGNLHCAVCCAGGSAQPVHRQSRIVPRF